MNEHFGLCHFFERGAKTRDQRLGSSTARNLGSSVANMREEESTCAPVSVLNNVLLPALV
jgi:hypothetical protein